jgi:hypothetical protein
MKLLHTLDVTSTLDEALNQAINYAERELEYRERQFARLHSLYDVAPALAGLSYSGITSVVISSEMICIFCTVPAFLSEDAPEFSEFLSAIEEAVGPFLTSRDNAEDNYRLYEGEHVKVFATPTDDASCQRVVTGKRMVQKSKTVEVTEEEYIHEYRC